MKTALLHGTIAHCREKVVHHAFSYPLFMVLIDLFDLHSLRNYSRLISYNRFNLLSIWDKDYLFVSPDSVWKKISAVLARHEVRAPSRIFLITVPRFLGYTFNPVSFYISLSESNEISSLTAEVNNTFGEKHMYVVKPSEGACSLPLRFRFPKRFFVSPFFDVSGEYEIVVHSLTPEISLSVNLFEESTQIFSTHLRCIPRPFTEKTLLLTLIKFPFSALLTMGRIYRQALALGWTHKVRAYKKPAPSSSDTIRSSQNLVHRLRLFFLSRFMRSAL